MSAGSHPTSRVRDERVLGEEAVWERPFGRFLLHAIGQAKVLYGLVACAWTAVYGLPLVIGLGLSRLIDRAREGPVDSVTWWLLGFAVAMMVLRAVALWAGLQLTFRLIFKISSWLKMCVLRSLLRRPVRRDTSVSVGETINRLRDDTQEIGGLIEWTTDLTYRVVLISIAIGVLATTDVVMTIPLALLFVGLFASVSLKSRVTQLQGQVRMKQGQLGGALSDTLIGVRDLRLSGAIGARMSLLEESFAERRKLQQKHEVFAILLADLFRNLVMFGIALVLLMASQRITAGEFTIGELILFITYAGWLSQHMSFFGKILARYQGGKVSYRRLIEAGYGLREREVAEVSLPEQLRELTASGLTRQAMSGGSIPVPFDLTIRAGEVVVIDGVLGSGKSTIVRTLLGLQSDGVGELRWNDQILVDPADQMRAPRVAFARQSAKFVAGTVRENLQLGDGSITEAEMERALKSVHLTPGTPELPDGLDKVLDSGEANGLSGGQRQRLALARMLCRRADLYVVDDCDSSLDGPTACSIWETVLREWPSAWVVVSRNADLRARADKVLTVSRGTDADD